MNWSLAGGSASWPADKRAAISAAMDAAVALYNANGYFPKTLWANYNSSVPTAQASYSGWIDFGGSISTRVALHEISHTLGVGQTNEWPTTQSGGKWNGTYAKNRVKLFDGASATLSCDAVHFWPYGLNYDTEDSTTNRVRHIKMVSALRRDMGIVSDSDNDGIPNDWEIFYFGDLSQTATADADGDGDGDGDGVNNLAEYNADTNPVAFTTQWTGTTSSDWTTASNWSPSTAPSNGTYFTRLNVNNGSNFYQHLHQVRRNHVRHLHVQPHHRASPQNRSDIILSSVGNSWSGTTSLFSSSPTGGAVKLAATNALPVATVFLVGGPGVSGRLDLNGFSQTLAGLRRSSTSATQVSTVTNSSATAATLTLNETTALSYSDRIVGTGSLIVTSGPALSPFESWMNSFPSLSSAQKLPSADPDADGINNLLEYVLNGTPTAANPNILPPTSLTPTHVIFSFTRREESTATTTQFFEYTTNLNTWTPLSLTAPTSSEVTLSRVSNGTRIITVQLPRPAPPNETLFGRFKVTQP